MRLIDADKLKRHYSWWEDFENLREQKKDFDTIIDLQPTVVPICPKCGGEVKE